MSQIKKSLCIVALICFIGFAWAELRESTDPSQFIAGGARSMAMGRTAVAVADDSHALFANPAAIATIDKMQFGLFMCKLFDEYEYMSVSSVMPTQFGQIGLSYASLGVNDIPLTSVAYDGVDFRVRSNGAYQMGDRLVAVSYGVKGLRNFPVFKKLDAGFTLKSAQSYISGSDSDSTLTGIGADVGIRFELGVLEGYRFGVALQNAVAPTFKEESASANADAGSAYARNMRFGLAKDFTLFNQNILGAFDMDNDGTHLGLEYKVDRSLALRGGLDNANPTLGLGLTIFSFYGFDYKPYTFAIDYAFHTYEMPLNNMHFISVSMLGITKTSRPSIESRFNSAVLTKNIVELTGISDPQAEVTIYVNNKMRKVVRTSDSGVWTVDSLFLDEGKNDIYVVAQIDGYVESDMSDTIKLMTDYIQPEMTTEVLQTGDEVLIKAKANKKLRAVVSKMADDSKLLLKYDKALDLWIGAWKIPSEFSNTYLSVQTVGIDNLDQKTSVSEDFLSTKFVDYPLDKTVSARDTLTVRGAVKGPVARIIANGVVVEPGEGGRFSVEIPVKELGKQVINVTAIDKNNTAVTASIRVLRVMESTDLDLTPWAKKEITDLLTLGVMQERKPDISKFDPKQYITRQEFARSLALIADLPISKNTFEDDRTQQYKPYIDAVVTAKYMTADEGNFKPDDFILRKDAIVALARMDKLSTKELPDKQLFEDVPSYVPYAGAVYAAVRATILTQREKFEPDKPLTRADAAVLFARTKLMRLKTADMYNWSAGYGDFAAEENQLTKELYTRGRLVAFDKPDSSLKIVSPQDETIVTGSYVYVKGISLQSSVLINGIQVPVSKNIFIATVKLKQGKNLLVINSGKEEVVLRVLKVSAYDNIVNTKENIRYNYVGSYARFADNTLNEKPLLRSELSRIMSGLTGKDEIIVTADRYVLWNEALKIANRYDNRGDGDRNLLQGIEDANLDYQISRRQFIDLLMNTNRYRELIRSVSDYSTYRQKENQATDVQAVDLGRKKSAVTTEDDAYLAFLAQYDNKSLAPKTRRTGDALAGASGDTYFDINYPQDGFVVTASVIQVVGVSKGNGNLKINGRRVLVDSDGNFTQDMELVYGKNKIRFEHDNEDKTYTGVRLITYADIVGLPERKLIEYISTVGYFKAAENFYPDQDVSREECAVLLARMLHETTTQPTTEVYPDVEANRWSATSIALLKEKGVLPKTGAFKPEETISQEEAARWFTALSSYKPKATGDDLKRVDLVKWLIQDSRVQADIKALRE